MRLHRQYVKRQRGLVAISTLLVVSMVSLMFIFVFLFSGYSSPDNGSTSVNPLNPTGLQLQQGVHYFSDYDITKVVLTEDGNDDMDISNLERTFIAVKPDGVARGLVQEIIARLSGPRSNTARGGHLRLVRYRYVNPVPREKAEEHYREHKGKVFYNKLIAYVTNRSFDDHTSAVSYGLFAMEWAGVDAVKIGRWVIGGPGVPGSIRGDFQDKDETTQNVVHGSDAVDSAMREIRLWFDNDTSAKSTVRETEVQSDSRSVHYDNHRQKKHLFQYVNAATADPPLAWVSNRPRIAIIPDFLKPEECDHYITVARPTMHRSKAIDHSKQTVNNTEEGSVYSSGRTSTQMWFPSEDSMNTAIIQRVIKYTGFPTDSDFEYTQVVHYETAQKLISHHDFVRNATENRAVTMLMYLTDVEEGGETIFPNADGRQPLEQNRSRCDRGIRIRPRRGWATLFYDMTPYGAYDMLSVHGGCPIIRGEKWVATVWMWVKGEDTSDSFQRM